jgi:hypothetical protein
MIFLEYTLSYGKWSKGYALISENSNNLFSKIFLDGEILGRSPRRYGYTIFITILDDFTSESTEDSCYIR